LPHSPRLFGGRLLILEGDRGRLLGIDPVTRRNSSGRVRNAAMAQATRIHEDIFDRNIDVQVLRLWEKLEVDPSPPRVIRTERGAGYAFALPVEPF
jgi:hypothetical protein